MSKIVFKESIERAVYGEHARRIRFQDSLTDGPWIYVGGASDYGTTAISPPFQNGWGNIGDPITPMRFRWPFTSTSTNPCSARG